MSKPLYVNEAFRQIFSALCSRKPEDRGCNSKLNSIGQASHRREGVGTWVLSCQGHSSSKPLSLDDRPLLLGSWDTPVRSSPRSIQVGTAGYRGFRSSQTHMPGRTHPQESRAGSACSAHSCTVRGVRNNQHGSWGNSSPTSQTKRNRAES